jgi:hypothetical protein
MKFSPRDFVIGVAAGMFLCALLFSYVFRMAAQKEEAMRWLRQRVAGR